MDDINPLVSVVVITYNSALTVLETLDSIKNQTYKNLELIVSDDCSKDSTVEICNKWIEKNRSRFVNVKLITSSKNTGISANCNRGYKAVNGEWIKGIAGDDILMDNCIQKNVDFLKTHDEARIVFSKCLLFKGDLCVLENNNFFYDFFKLPYIEQYRVMLHNNVIPAPTAFIHLETLKRYGYTDENYPFLEDYPLWFKFLKNRIKFYFFDEFTVYYRMEDSVSKGSSMYIHPKFLYSLESFYRNVLFHEYTWKMFLYKYHRNLDFCKLKVAINLFKNRKTIFSKCFLAIFNVVDPYFYFQKFKR